MMLVIYGPTATGKTNLSITLAKKYNGEIISADSRQVYKGLDIGTGKVSPESKVEKHQNYWIVDNIKIWGFDLIGPQKEFTVVDFIKFANQKTQVLQKENKLPILAGGTGFYIKALIDGIDTMGVDANQKLRKSLSKLSAGKLYKKLTEINPNRARLMNESDRQNPRRLIRAIEIALSKTKPITCYQLPATNFLIVGLTAPNDYLYKRADYWLSQRLSIGLLDEVQKLINNNVSPKWLESLGLEYRWLTRYIQKEVTFDSAISRLKGDTHSYIRRQKTWFNQFPQISLYDISKQDYQRKLEKKLSL